METTPITPGHSSPLPSQIGRAAGGEGFKEVVESYLKEVNDLQQQADKAVFELASGRTDNLHQVVAAISEADLSFRLMMQIRNKLLEAYKEIMRMQV